MAANTREIRRRIQSIKNTAQITNAMQMVAAAKMRKAQAAALAGRPYAELINRVLVSVRRRAEVCTHPLLEPRPREKRLIILLTPDKGLCGALNTNLLREVATLKDTECQFATVGRKGLQYLSRTGRPIAADFRVKEHPTLREAKVISKYAIDRFLKKKVDEVSVLYTRFHNTLKQEPVFATLLPVSPFGPSSEIPGEDDIDYLYEPNAEEVLNAILPHYLHYEVYQMVLDARASEQSARMVAMKTATDNARRIIKTLSLEANKARQSAITTELLEITTAQIALE